MNNRSKYSRFLSITSLVVILMLSACANLPAPIQTPTGSGTMPTPAIDVTQAPSESPTQEPTAQSATPSAVPQYSGFMLLTNREFKSMDFSGQPLGFTAPAGTTEFIQDGGAGVTRDSVFLATNTGLLLVKTDGINPLTFAGNGNVTSAGVSRDGTKVAWVTQQVVDNSGQISSQVDLQVAGIDGSNPVKAAEFTPAQSAAAPMTFTIIEWTAEGKLLYGTQPVGIGGYILFSGYINLYLFDPASGQTTTLYQNTGPMNMCFNSISADLTQLAVGCKTIEIQNVVSGAKVELPAVADQNFAGSAKFSPSGKLIAYGVGRGNPDSEFGRVVVAPADGSGDQTIVATIEGGYYQVLGWIDENTLLLRTAMTTSATPGIWKVSIDGSGLTKLADGWFVGFIY